MITIAILFIAFIALFFITTNSTPVIHNDIPTPTFNLEEKENHRLVNDINDRIDDIKDDVEWYSQPAIVRDNYECEPKVRATGKKWDADTLARKEKNMKAKNSKAKGNFKPWQH